MPAEAACKPLAIHASAVAIDDRALLIRGASRAGKSRLALALIAHSTPEMPIRLIGDDRILLNPVAGGLMARPHARIAGFIERRGLGLVAMPWVAQARVGGIVDLHPSGATRPAPVCFSLSERMPQLVVTSTDEFERVARVLAWWAELTATSAPHPSEKADDAGLASRKRLELVRLSRFIYTRPL